MDAQQLTAPVRAKDQRIVELEDLVRDAIEELRSLWRRGNLGCPCGGDHPHRPGSMATGRTDHDPACWIKRAERALRRTP